MFTMELLSHAKARGARVYAEVLGGALTSDGFNIVAPEPTGKYATLAITRALANARLDADAIDMICAHGTSTRANDRTKPRRSRRRSASTRAAWRCRRPSR